MPPKESLAGRALTQPTQGLITGASRYPPGAPALRPWLGTMRIDGHDIHDLTLQSPYTAVTA